ncbi:50S ribosomal protein L25/general stress protein Ctc [Arthrobacter agilis]|uniref:50S ribosomal protein L25/general stress protein Ctc n=1 Tax=Arthrobacter agilis TaxID=37921 RepID=UPI000B35D7F7|nr:50S ribosomal protein L25/general stress protein Ctc [Arthrobacter agilis]OUM40489.1 50S ribosomal protein L25/general stress protein Ctc [Arthrobacter agilis]PPB45101.1 50S ribosomal protein L25 [Arthrobacter agilis]TPV27806.1 50S ribosomal protein L25/general stress protein Ctc [Arthrobacter agilis]VDR31539.1 General stress protein CTC [Arthrobacter agilis]
MSEQKLAAHVRTEFGKGAARQARRANMIPAVIYGHGADPIHVLLPAKATTLAVRTPNALLTLDVDGEDHLALVKDIQRNAIKQIVEHLDLLTVRRGEKVEVDVTIHVEGEPTPDTTWNLETTTLLVEAEATHLPETLTVTIEGRGIGEHIYAADVVLPQGVSLVTDPETLVVNLMAPVVQDLGETEETEVDPEATSEGATAPDADKDAVITDADEQ